MKTYKIKEDKEINFDELKFLSTLQGYTELADFLKNGTPQVRKYIKEVSNKKNIIDEKVLEVKGQVDKFVAKKIREQANEFGYKVSIWNWGIDNGTQAPRQVRVGRYS